MDGDDLETMVLELELELVVGLVLVEREPVLEELEQVQLVPVPVFSLPLLYQGLFASFHMLSVHPRGHEVPW